MQLAPESKYLSWYKTDTFELLVEPYNDIVFLHMNITKWSKTTIYQMIDILQEIEQAMSELGYKYLLMFNEHQTRSWKTLVTRFAKGKLLGSIEKGIHVYGKELKWA